MWGEFGGSSKKTVLKTKKIILNKYFKVKGHANFSQRNAQQIFLNCLETREIFFFSLKKNSFFKKRAAHFNWKTKSQKKIYFNIERGNIADLTFFMHAIYLVN